MRVSSHFALALVLYGGASLLAQAPSTATSVVSCKQVTTAKPHVGVAYRGGVTNEDYKFTAKIPAGLTGWSGVDASAPFHGFTIFLDPARRSCIYFEVHLRVDNADAPARPVDAINMSLGKAKAWQIASGKAGSSGNVTTGFSFDNGGDVDEGQILLVAPAGELKRVKPLYEAFLKSLRFGEN